MVNVKGKWALITGASRGIGYLSALFMAEQGCNLILHGRTKEHCEKVLAEVKAKGVEAYAVGAELSDLTQVEKMLADIEKYGLYTYEDFAEHFSYEIFEYCIPVKYLKVAVGKGMITYEELLELFNKYSGDFIT